MGDVTKDVLIDQAADRGRFVCQSQSLNLFLEDPNTSKISSMHMYAWKQGLKTGMYYLRTRPKARAVQFTVDPATSLEAAKAACSLENKDECTMCSA
jgi:ribonucleotide reductase alpha subunit